MRYTPDQLEAIRNVLQDLLEYEGGEMQSMNEQNTCHVMNTHILHKANSLGIVLDVSEIGR